MTNEEAISYLECGAVPSCCCASNKRHGGTCEGEDAVAEALTMAKKALEKQTAKKVTSSTLGGYETFCELCPGCYNPIFPIFRYCAACGQKLDWTEKEEEKK